MIGRVAPLRLQCWDLAFTELCTMSVSRYLTAHIPHTPCWPATQYIHQMLCRLTAMITTPHRQVQSVSFPRTPRPAAADPPLISRQWLTWYHRRRALLRAVLALLLPCCVGLRRARAVLCAPAVRCAVMCVGKKEGRVSRCAVEPSSTLATMHLPWAPILGIECWYRTLSIGSRTLLLEYLSPGPGHCPSAV